MLLKRVLPLILGVLLSCFTIVLKAQTAGKQAEETVAKYYQAFYRQQWKEAAEMMHPEALKKLHGLFIHIGETPTGAKDMKEFLAMFGGVKTLDAFRKLDSKRVFIYAFTSLAQYADPVYQKMWQSSRIKVIGAVREGDLIHVVSRTFADIENSKGSVVSVASVKQYQGKWKVYTSAELDRMAQKVNQ